MKLKLKGRFESIPMMAVLCIFAAGLVAILPLRTYQLMRLVEPETGFYSGHSATIPALYILLAVFTVVLVAISYLSGDVPVRLWKRKISALASYRFFSLFRWWWMPFLKRKTS